MPETNVTRCRGPRRDAPAIDERADSPTAVGGVRDAVVRRLAVAAGPPAPSDAAEPRGVPRAPARRGSGSAEPDPTRSRGSADLVARRDRATRQPRGAGRRRDWSNRGSRRRVGGLWPGGSALEAVGHRQGHRDRDSRGRRSGPAGLRWRARRPADARNLDDDPAVGARPPAHHRERRRRWPTGPVSLMSTGGGHTTALVVGALPSVG